jgi:hypothetical protein
MEGSGVIFEKLNKDELCRNGRGITHFDLALATVVEWNDNSQVIYFHLFSVNLRNSVPPHERHQQQAGFDQLREIS